MITENSGSTRQEEATELGGATSPLLDDARRPCRTSWPHQGTKNCACGRIASVVQQLCEYHIIAHNGGKYDNHFLINEIQDYVTDEKITVEKLAKGTRYLSIVVKYTLKQKTHTITFGDSLTKIQSPLEKMPKMFHVIRNT